MQAALDSLLERIRDAQENGDTIGVSWLLQEERYSSLLQQITAQRDSYAPTAATATAAAQSAAVETAAKAAESWTYLSVGARGVKQAAAVGVVWNKLPVDRLEAYVGLAGDGSPLRNLFTSVSTDRANDVRDILFSGIGSGESAKSIAARLQTVSDVSAARARLIARTEVNRAHRAAAIGSYANNAGIIDGWIWKASCDSRTCTACWAMHGSWHANDEPFGSHPACRCSAVPSVRDLRTSPGQKDLRPKVELGPDRFEALSDAEKKEILGPALFKKYKAGE
ncbi:MAG: phage minor head protein, partial [Armatimonadota bacterium]